MALFICFGERRQVVCDADFVVMKTSMAKWVNELIGPIFGTGEEN